jgi:uncharacterized protein
VTGLPAKVTDAADPTTVAAIARRALAVLAVPPLVFLVVTVGFAVYFASHGGQAEQIAEQTQDAASWILLVVQVVLLAWVALLSRSAGAIDWTLPDRRRLPVELVVGGACGVGLGVVYVLALAPALTWIQGSFGDYVPPGSVLPTVGRSIWPFLVADVLLAPFVEESIYRGWAVPRLLPHFGAAPTVVIVCCAFGALHWAGGVWYMVLVGFVAGGLFIALRLARGNLAAPFAAHLALNVVEYLFVWLTR